MNIDTSTERLACLRKNFADLRTFNVLHVNDSRLVQDVVDVIAALEAERDAAFKMSRCECASDEACRNLAQAWAERDAALADVKKERQRAVRLWMLLDDVDTADDIAKSNDTLYRKLCRHAMKQRFDELSSTEIDAALAEVNPAMTAAIDEVTR